jgi:antimicrobial peptide system SdpA family protein
MTTHSSGAPVEAPPAHRALGALTLAAGLSAAIFATYALHSALPANAIDLPFERSAHVREWFPEGWAFFTAPAQREQATPFTRRAGEWVSSNAGPNSRWSNALGMSRRARGQSVEIAKLIEQLAPDDWSSCDQANATCFDRAVTHAVQSRSLHPTLCGEVVISKARPVPWAWSQLKTPVAMPTQVLRMDVQC